MNNFDSEFNQKVTDRHWPLFGLAVKSKVVELKISTDSVIGILIDLMNAGIHSPEQRPFSTPWNLLDLPERNYEFAKRVWAHRAALRQNDWYLDFTIIYEGQIVGMQSVFAKEFPVSRAFMSSSWLGGPYQRKGIGSVAREAMLFLMFQGLDALEGHSEAYEDNFASIRVCEKLGYHPNGFRSWGRDNKPARSLQFVITKDDFSKRSHDGFEIVGLNEAKELLGLG